MSNENSPNQEKIVSSAYSLESEINTSRINALELKIETLSIITESLWNIVQRSDGQAQSELQHEMAKVISSRAKRDKETVTCVSCRSVEVANKSMCSQCGAALVYDGKVSPFDY